MQMRPVADHFSQAAAGYASFRPGYPPALFAWLADLAPDRTCAWDCATGSGQAARGLAPHFARVVATDASLQQVLHAEQSANIAYAVMRAEQVALGNGTASLVCVAQALHWFDRSAFYAEALRVLKPGGILAAWRYALATISPGIDAIVHRFFHETVGPFWPPERAIVDAGYARIDFPVREIVSPAFDMAASWTLSQLAGYLRTWSAVTHYRAARGTDPVTALLGELESAWGRDTVRQVRWPLEVRLARVS